MDLDIDHLRGWIGNNETMSERLTPQLVARFNATLDIEEDAVTGAEAPLMIHFCLAQPVAAASHLGHDGHPKRGGFLPPVSLPRRMWAGGEITFHAPLVIDEMVTRTSRIDNVDVKQGRSGTLCFVTVIHEYSCGDALAALGPGQHGHGRGRTLRCAQDLFARPKIHAEGCRDAGAFAHR